MRAPFAVALSLIKFFGTSLKAQNCRKGKRWPNLLSSIEDVPRRQLRPENPAVCSNGSPSLPSSGATVAPDPADVEGRQGTAHAVG